MQQKTRYSKKREAILTALQSTKIHPNAEWVLNHLKTDYPDLSLGTVYRNLSYFKAQGTITSVGVVNGQERFDATTHPHAHFVCECCNSVLDVEGLNPTPQLEPDISNAYGFSVTRSETVLYGLCKKCLKHKRSSTPA